MVSFFKSITNIKVNRPFKTKSIKSLFTFYFSFIIVTSLLVSVISCSKNSDDTTIPNVPVNFTIYLTLPQYSNLNSVGSYALVDGYGYRGIIVYRRAIDEFIAFDLACPYDPTTAGAKLAVDSSGITMVDAHCGSKFSLYSGSIIKGPATRPMKAYSTSYDAISSSVSVYN